MKQLFFLALITFYATQLYAQAVRERISLDKDWRFHFGHAADASKDFNFSIATIFSKTGKADGTAIQREFKDSLWSVVNVPHDWAVELPFAKSENFDVMAHGYKPVGGLFPETSIGWYRKQFAIAAADSGKRFTIQFDGVFRNSQVWLNGCYLGRHESGYTGFTYDVTDYVDFHKNNVLVVRVDATQYEGWFYEGAGIYRHVWLNKFNDLHFNETTFIHTKTSGQRSVVSLEIPVQNTSLASHTVTMNVLIKDRTGKIVGKTKDHSLTLGAGGTVICKDSIVIANAALWSVADPYLYKASLTLANDGGILDSKVIRFGVREIIITPERGLLVNGNPVKLKGVNCHQDHAGVGSAVPDFLQYYRIRLLKEMGANAYRTSHHPPTPELLDACDSLGMLVLDETRLLNSSDEYKNQLSDLILRDRNRACVFLWSIGNEEGFVQTTSTGKRIALSSLQLQRSLDPTRVSTYAADVGNVFSGVNEVIPVRGFNYREKFVVPYHNDHPRQPVMGTEMGSTVTTRGIYRVDSLNGYVPDQDITAPWWASTAQAWWPTAATNDWHMGGFIWTGFDYRGEPTPFKWPNISSHFGVMDVCGFPKNLYYYYQSWWVEKNVLHISPHWNWKTQTNKAIDVWVNSNADEVELLLNGKSLGKKKMERNSHLRWTVDYAPGKLEARATRNGTRMNVIVETTDAPYKLDMKVDRSAVRADGADGTIVNVTVLDKNGRPVPDAMNRIDFKISGSGKIIGTGNGDPSSHEADRCGDQVSCQRSLFNGKCQVILQSSGEPGVMQLEASSPGLIGTTVSVKTKTENEYKISMK